MTTNTYPRLFALSFASTLAFAVACGDDGSSPMGNDDGQDTGAGTSSNDGDDGAGSGGGGSGDDDGDDGGTGTGGDGTTSGGGTGDDGSTGDASGTGDDGDTSDDGGSGDDGGTGDDGSTGDAGTTGDDGTSGDMTTTDDGGSSDGTSGGDTNTGPDTTSDTGGSTTTGGNTDTDTTSPSLECVDTCNGCCDGQTCLSGDSDDMFCGRGGNRCVACEAWESCMAADCQLDEDHEWIVTVVSATVGGTWDTGGCSSNYGYDVDPYVELDVDGNTGTTNVIEDDDTPEWNEDTLQLAAGVLTGNELTITISDADCCCNPEPDQIDECTYQITESDLLTGGFTIEDCGINVDDVVFEVRPS